MPPQYVNDPMQIKQWVEEKQALEVELAWELLDIFNTTDTLINPIRERAAAAAYVMLEAYQGSDELQYAVSCAWFKEHTAAGGPGPLRDFLTRYPSLDSLFNRALYMDAQDCSMLIRLYGGFVEQAAIYAYGPFNELAQRQLEYRRGFLDLGDTAIELEQAGIEPEGHWLNLMQRLRRRTSPAGLSWLVDIWNAPQGFIRSSGGGISGFELLADDTVLKIDRVFGLMPGASISGTTTDLMSFMDTFSGVGDWDPIYYLLACADFVARGHHTLVETALPLALNGYVDYSIGFYTSLMPTGHRGKPATSHSAQGVIWDALNKAENDSRNRLMLIDYDGMWYKGCYITDRGDQSFKLLATADDNMLMTFSTHFPDQWATHQQVFNWMKLYYPV